ncbi:MAG TPA: hypothetical protein VNA69_12215 [Thermoanaerobaculia bacterium]|nr:hypothetical protein [Thermoanaerobaculia bacterium]
MNKWVIRIVGVLMILLFMIIMTMMYRQLVALQRAQTHTSSIIPACPESS